MRIRSQQGTGSSLVSHAPVELVISDSETTPDVPSEPDVSSEPQSHGPDRNPPVDESPTIEPEGEGQSSEEADEHESEQGSEPEDPDFDRARFLTKAAEVKFNDNYSKRPVLCERGIKLEDYVAPPYELKDLFVQRNWLSWVTVSRMAIVPYVREFFSNAEVGALHGKPVITTTVRGKTIFVHPEKIALVGVLPPFKAPATTPRLEAQWKEQLGKDNLARLLSGKPQAKWVGARFAKSELTPRSNILHMIVCSLILPQAYRSSVSLEQAAIIGKLILGIPINLAHHIWSVISQAVEKPETNAGLPFGGLITRIVLQCGIEEEVGMETVRPASMIAKSSVKRSQGQLGKKSAAAQPENVEGSSAPAPLSLEEKIEQIQKNQEVLMSEVNELKVGQQKIIRLLEGMSNPTDGEEAEQDEETESE